MRNDETCLLNIRISEDLKYDFQMLCLRNRTTMTAELVRAIREHLYKAAVDQDSYNCARSKQELRASSDDENIHGSFIKDPNTDVWKSI